MLMSQATHKQNPTNTRVSKANECTKGATQGTVRVQLQLMSGMSAALGSLDTARRPSTKDMPKTANRFAYTASL